MKDTLLFMVLIQTLAQIVIFFSTAWMLRFIIQGIVNIIGMQTRKKINILTTMGCLFLNIIITILAKMLTGQGGLSGTANLGASILLSIVMWITFRKNGIYEIKEWKK